jgi:hypothetical protein
MDFFIVVLVVRYVVMKLLVDNLLYFLVHIALLSHHCLMRELHRVFLNLVLRVG